MFYFRATVSQLKSFIASAPEHLRPRLPAFAAKDNLLEEIFRLREEESRISTDRHQGRQALSKLLSMNPADITSLASTDAAKLKSLMSSALVSDAALEPRDLGDCEPNQLGMIVLARQLDALKQARAIIDQPPPQAPHVTFNLEDRNPQHPRVNPPPISATVRDNRQIVARQQSRIEAIPNPTPSSRQPRDVNALSTLLHPADARPISRARESQQQLCDSSEDNIPRSGRKKRKSAINPTFSYGAQASQANLICTYPGKGVSSSSLHIDNLWLPSVLCSRTAGEMDIPTFLAQFQHWKRLANGSPSHDEIEAHTIGRAIHVEILEHHSPKEALETPVHRNTIATTVRYSIRRGGSGQERNPKGGGLETHKLSPRVPPARYNHVRRAQRGHDSTHGSREEEVRSPPSNSRPQSLLESEQGLEEQHHCGIYAYLPIALTRLLSHESSKHRITCHERGCALYGALERTYALGHTLN